MKQLPRFRLFGLLLSLLTLTAHAQAPAWQWAVTPGEGDGLSTAVDAVGNVYVTGSFSRVATFGAHRLVSAGETDVFVAKFDASGACQWATRAGGSDFEMARGISVDGSGHVSIIGDFASGTAAFGATQLTNHNTAGSDVFVAHLDPAGSWQWAVGAGGPGEEYGQALTVDGSGNLYVTGFSTSNTASFGATVLTNLDIGLCFVACLTPAGTWQWVSATSGGGASGNAIAVAPTGEVYVTGNFSNWVTFGAVGLSVNTASDVFVAQLSAAGAWQWARQVTGDNTDSGRGLVLDPQGNVYVSGAFTSTDLRFGNTMIANVSPGQFDIFVAKLTPSGNWQWAVGAGGSGSDFGAALTRDATGNLYLTGSIYSLAAVFGSMTLTTSGQSSEAFVARLSSAGGWQWATGTAGGGIGSGLAASGTGQLYVTGTATGSALTLGTIILPTANGLQPFLAQLATVNGLPQETTAGATFQVYPNPAHHTVTLTGATSPTAEIVDALGRVVRTAPLAALTAHLDLTGLPAGLYVVRCGGVARRLVVE